MAIVRSSVKLERIRHTLLAVCTICARTFRLEMGTSVNLRLTGKNYFSRWITFYEIMRRLVASSFQFAMQFVSKNHEMTGASCGEDDSGSVLDYVVASSSEQFLGYDLKQCIGALSRRAAGLRNLRTLRLAKNTANCVGPAKGTD